MLLCAFPSSFVCCSVQRGVGTPGFAEEVNIGLTRRFGCV